MTLKFPFFHKLITVSLVLSAFLQGKDSWTEDVIKADQITVEYQEKYPAVISEKIVFKTVVLPNGETLELDFQLERPKVDEHSPTPVVFYVHGGGWVKGTKSVFTHQSFALANNGIAGVRLEYRLKQHGAKYPEAMSDVMDAIDYIRKHAKELNIDFTRVGMVGGSAGGHLSAIAAQKTPECICYDGYNGLFDAFDRDKSKFGGGNYTGRTPKEKKAASAIYNIKAKPPHTFLYHGSKDTTIDIKQSLRFKQAIIEKGGAAELLEYKGVGHSFFNKEPYLSLTTQALLDHNKYVFGLSDEKPVLSDYRWPLK